VLKQGINIKTTCPNYLRKFRKTTLHLLQVYLGMWAKKDTVLMCVKLLVIVILALKGYLSMYCLMQGSCFIWSSIL